MEILYVVYSFVFGRIEVKALEMSFRYSHSKTVLVFLFNHCPIKIPNYIWKNCYPEMKRKMLVLKNKQGTTKTQAYFQLHTSEEPVGEMPSNKKF